MKDAKILVPNSLTNKGDIYFSRNSFVAVGNLLLNKYLSRMEKFFFDSHQQGGFNGVENARDYLTRLSTATSDIVEVNFDMFFTRHVASVCYMASTEAIKVEVAGEINLDAYKTSKNLRQFVSNLVGEDAEPYWREVVATYHGLSVKHARLTERLRTEWYWVIAQLLGTVPDKLMTIRETYLKGVQQEKLDHKQQKAQLEEAEKQYKETVLLNTGLDLNTAKGRMAYYNLCEHEINETVFGKVYNFYDDLVKAAFASGGTVEEQIYTTYSPRKGAVDKKEYVLIISITTRQQNCEYPRTRTCRIVVPKVAYDYYKFLVQKTNTPHAN